MKKNLKPFKIFVIVLNIIGILCLVYYAIPYIMHDTTIPNPDAMLAVEKWDGSGFVLTFFGLIPLFVANILAYIFIKLKPKVLRFLFFIPSIICLIIVLHYIFVATDLSDYHETNEPIKTMKFDN